MDGILGINKDRGMTSHDVVFKLRKILKTKKVGHTGTLDPEVDGVLPICIGRATRVSDYVMESGKRYKAEVTLGIQTTTEDAHGEIVNRISIPENQYDELMIDEVLQQLTGTIEQIPPMYSAVKVNGRKLYEYARNNETVDRPVRHVEIHELFRTSEIVYNDDTAVFSLEVSCGKGTYIRTLATQIAERLGTIGHMSDLTRTESGGFTLDECVSLSELVAMEFEAISHLLKPIEAGLKGLPHIKVDENTAQRIKFGQKLSREAYPIENETVMTYNEKVLAIYMPDVKNESLIKARKVFPDE